MHMVVTSVIALDYWIELNTIIALVFFLWIYIYSDLMKEDKNKQFTHNKEFSSKHNKPNQTIKNWKKKQNNYDGLQTKCVEEKVQNTHKIHHMALPS